MAELQECITDDSWKQSLQSEIITRANAEPCPGTGWVLLSMLRSSIFIQIL